MGGRRAGEGLNALPPLQARTPENSGPEEVPVTGES